MTEAEITLMAIEKILAHNHTDYESGHWGPDPFTERLTEDQEIEYFHKKYKEYKDKLRQYSNERAANRAERPEWYNKAERDGKACR